jgi:hypothetical protein
MPLINLHASRKLLLLILCLMIGTLYSLLSNSLSVPWKAIIFLILCLQVYPYVKKQIRLAHPESILGISKSNSAFWTLQLRNNEILYAFLNASSLATNFLLVLNFTVEGKRKMTAVIIKDTVGEQAFKQLSAQVRHNP